MSHAHDTLQVERAHLERKKKDAERRIQEYQRDMLSATKIVGECERGISEIDAVLEQLAQGRQG